MITGFKLDCRKSLSSDEAYTAKRNKSNVPKELASNDIQTTKNGSFLHRLHSSVSTVYIVTELRCVLVKACYRYGFPAIKLKQDMKMTNYRISS